ncbi:PTS sugar transporter subunit IIA [Alkalibacterium sp. 20]|uniref:PTS sugar transporter subunit IIA n=1 Tax=Alkalibacterium sp. 20 TaxID=1798803 RepID=UPI0009001085|nr:PTS sugar transporter subunit IIA [Alkalibacterium sp. 20]OJF90661.1 hypothetical protein AX762_11660 [Alkalibacterium sp. 20]
MGINVETKVILDLNNKYTDKKSFFAELCEVIHNEMDEKVLAITIKEALEEREKVVTTGFGNELAIPHGKVEGLISPYLFFVRVKNPIEWQAMDDEKVKFIFVILVPSDDKDNNHLKVLSILSYNLMDSEYQKMIKTVKDEEEAKNIIEKMVAVE